jgi:predicted secreted Zn-dependent protease
MMKALSAAFAAIGASAQAGLPLPSGSLRFADIPNVAVTYYEVTGNDIPEIHKSLSKAAPRDPATRNPMPATSSWSIGAAVKWSRKGDRCTITGVTLNFTGKAAMPRLIAGKDTPAPVLAQWNRYVAQLEARQAGQLRFAWEHRGTVEQAIGKSSCERWQAAAAAAIADVNQEQQLVFKIHSRVQPKLEQIRAEPVERTLL